MKDRDFYGSDEDQKIGVVGTENLCSSNEFKHVWTWLSTSLDFKSWNSSKHGIEKNKNHQTSSKYLFVLHLFWFSHSVFSYVLLIKQTFPANFTTRMWPTPAVGKAISIGSWIGGNVARFRSPKLPPRPTGVDEKRAGKINHHNKWWFWPWNPYDPCFEWKRPCFGGLTFKNRGHVGSRCIYYILYIYIYSNILGRGGWTWIRLMKN